MPVDTFFTTDLFRILTDEERLLVQKFQVVQPVDLPKFFNAGTQVVGEEPQESISREFEAFLILQATKNPDVLSAATIWFNEAATLQLQRDDRDALLDEAYAFEKKDALAKVQEIRTRTGLFNVFRATFQQIEVPNNVDPSLFPADRFSGVPEIGLIMRDSQAVMGEIASDQSREEHRLVMTEVLDVDRLTRRRTQDNVGGIADDRIAEELLSWRDVISQMQARVTGA
jgi:hypothetical protein